MAVVRMVFEQNLDRKRFLMYVDWGGKHFTWKSQDTEVGKKNTAMCEEEYVV